MAVVKTREDKLGVIQSRNFNMQEKKNVVEQASQTTPLLSQLRHSG